MTLPKFDQLIDDTFEFEGLLPKQIVTTSSGSNIRTLMKKKTEGKIH